MMLREYQQRANDEAKAAWQDVRRVLLTLPTGGGKTECAIALAGDEIGAGKRVLVVVDRKVLCVQWRERFYRHGFDHVGILQGENTMSTWAPILVATAQTLRARGIPEGVALVVLDESHIWHETHDRVLAECGNAKVLGLSATPLREGLGGRFDKLVIGATIKELTAAGHLVPARVFAPSMAELQKALEQISVRAGEFASNELSALMRKKGIVGDVVSNWKERGENRQTIVFCVDKQHARDLADEFNLDGVPAAVIIDETSDEDRASIFARFERGEMKVLTSVGVLGVGFDAPIAGCAILARPTLSTMLHIQQCGRVLRPYPGKPDAIILDHAANTMRHGLPIDFVPPTELSDIVRGTDRKRKDRAVSELVCCRNCEAIYARVEDACPECGTPRTIYTKAMVLEGKLVDVTYASDQPEPDGITPRDVEDFYRQMLWVCDNKGWKRGAAWFKTCKKYSLSDDFHNQLTNAILPRFIRDSAQPLPPTHETLRWLSNQRKQWFVAKQHEANNRTGAAA